MVPYLVLVVLVAIDQVNQELKSHEIDDLINSTFKARMLMIEHFTVCEMGYGEGYYAFVSFKHVEKSIEDLKL